MFNHFFIHIDKRYNSGDNYFVTDMASCTAFGRLFKCTSDHGLSRPVSHNRIEFISAAVTKRTCKHVRLVTAARVKYPVVLQCCKFDAL